MGFLDKIKESGRGVVTAARPDEGVEPQPADGVRRRLLAITGKGVEAREHDGKVTVAWSAKIASAGLGGHYEEVHRAIEISLDEDKREAAGRTVSETTKAGVGLGALLSGSFSRSKSSGQAMGSETFYVVGWLGPHETEGGADEKGYKFSWSSLRDPVIEAVTGAGWTYKPKKA